MLNEASLTDVMEPVGAIFLSRTALKEKLFHSGGLMQSAHQKRLSALVVFTFEALRIVFKDEIKLPPHRTTRHTAREV